MFVPVHEASASVPATASPTPVLYGTDATREVSENLPKASKLEIDDAIRAVLSDGFAPPNKSNVGAVVRPILGIQGKTATHDRIRNAGVLLTTRTRGSRDTRMACLNVPK
jgi:hypothetical protein